MGQYDFTYEIPEPADFKEALIKFLYQNGGSIIAQVLPHCQIEYEDMGYAYYAGVKSGDTWNKYALDFTIEGTEQSITTLKRNQKALKDAIQKVLRPSKSGYLVRKVEFIISDNEFEIVLPETEGESFDVLSGDIYDALRRNEPTLVLDRLHTYATKYLREICMKHGIPIADNNGDNYPLHNLIGSLTKYYESNRTFDSDFSISAMKMSISIFERYNAIRNNKSYAHVNDVLGKAEATYVVTIVTATLAFIHEIEAH